MPCLSHDVEGAGSVACGLRRKPRPERVSRESFRVESRPGHGPLEDGPNRIPMQPHLAGLAMPVDFAEERAGDDPGRFDPLAERGHRAGGGMGSPGNSDLSSLPCLVGLRAAQGEHRAFGHPGKIVDGKGGELRPAQPSRVPDQQERPVAHSGETGGKVGQHLDQVCGQKRGLARLGGPKVLL